MISIAPDETCPSRILVSGDFTGICIIGPEITTTALGLCVGVFTVDSQILVNLTILFDALIQDNSYEMNARDALA
jgi:hypothetical protein